ncbi:MAG: NUDIX hydrolase [Clostridia bacterium]|nr:NUDIX hydrolase [Clostridia bacterium]
MVKETTVKVNYIYKGRILNLRNDDILLPDGRPAMREIVEHSGGAAILAIDENNMVYLTTQYRYPYKGELTELPAGKLDKGEDPFNCARRELREETGLVADSIEFLGQLYPSPGYCEEIIYIFLAKGLHKGEESPDDDEFLVTEKVPFNKLLQMVMSNEIKDAKTIFATLFYSQKYNKDAKQI